MPAPSPATPSTNDPLTTYREKRDFSRTQEPAGERATAETSPQRAPRFVVQRHRARRLHYDFRLEIDGVLASWAVPKGPTLDPKARRAAFHVEDHPIEYFDFEGVIPRGEYGGGDVIVWDEGTWDPYETGDPPDPGKAVRDGEIHMVLHGHKLGGKFVLVRTSTDSKGKEQWLMLHKHDEFAVDGWDPEEHPQSVLSGRTNDQVKADPDRLWRSDLPADRASISLRPAAGTAGASAGAAAEAAGTAGPEVAGPGEDALRKLDALPGEGIWQVFGRELHVTNLDKVLFPARPGEAAVTKRDLVRYTAQIASVALPYLKDRALNMHRFPGGADTKGFWHKELPSHAPDWLPRWDNPEADRGESRTYLVVDEPAALVWAANFGALEWHAWTSLTSSPHQPTYALIDLDPGPVTTWEDVLVLARLHRTALDHLGVSGQPKVTGQRGIQIWIPIQPGPSFTETRKWTEQLSKTIAAVVPELVSWKWQVSDRSGLARLDYTQNAINKTLVAPYSPRPAPGAPVSAPITWEELDDPSLKPDGFTIRSVLGRIEAQGDVFRTVLRQGQHLPSIG
ncbi:MAG: DNA polymerase ligase N-terminal domain-containing protein [Acidimicrobiales bacterium]